VRRTLTARPWSPSSTSGPALVVLLCGEFDLSARDRLRAALACDAYSLRALVHTAQHLAGRRGVTLLDPKPILHRALRMVLARSGGPAIAIRPTS
jgi:hypothetical protein